MTYLLRATALRLAAMPLEWASGAILAVADCAFYRFRLRAFPLAILPASVWCNDAARGLLLAAKRALEEAGECD
jgi:hypothetical protein